MSSTNPVIEWVNLHEGDSNTVTKRLSAESVLKLLQEKPETISILDLRNDRDPAILQRSVGIPATTLTNKANIKHEVIDKLIQENPNLDLIVIHCNSSRKRASIVGAWIQDYLDSNPNEKYQVAILDGGIVGWLELPEPYKSFLIPFKKA